MSGTRATVCGMAITGEVRAWLLDSDPAIRWQVERDLERAAPEVWQATRRRVATEGFGARLLALQDPDGQWAGGAFFPAGFLGSAEEEEPGQPWVATTWALKDLREWGVDATVLGDTADRLAANSRWEYEDLPYWGGEIDVCINSFTLASGAWLGVDVSGLADWFVTHRLDDGGWNCEAEEGESTRSSFHSTLNAVRGLLAYERYTGDTRVQDARRGGEEYLLSRNLMFRASTGEQAGPFATQFVAPSRWRYSVLAALDHFRDAGERSSADERMAAAIAVVRDARMPDGRWLQGSPLAGRTWFDVDAPEGEPSRWLTLIGSRVLEWADTGSHPGSSTAASGVSPG